MNKKCFRCSYKKARCFYHNGDLKVVLLKMEDAGYVTDFRHNKFMSEGETLDLYEAWKKLGCPTRSDAMCIME